MRQWIEDYKNGGTMYKEQQEHEEQPREVSALVLASLHIQTDKKFRNIFVLGCMSTNVVDPGHFGTESDPALLVRELQDANKQKFKKRVFAYYFLR
jgi:hypothetical protein